MQSAKLHFMMQSGIKGTEQGGVGMSQAARRELMLLGAALASSELRARLTERDFSCHGEAFRELKYSLQGEWPADECKALRELMRACGIDYVSPREILGHVIRETRAGSLRARCRERGMVFGRISAEEIRKLAQEVVRECERSAKGNLETEVGEPPAA